MPESWQNKNGVMAMDNHSIDILTGAVEMALLIYVVYHLRNMPQEIIKILRGGDLDGR